MDSVNEHLDQCSKPGLCKVEWIPGTAVTLQDVQQDQPFKEAGFYIALLHIWLEPNPADWKPKDARFGKAG